MVPAPRIEGKTYPLTLLQDWNRFYSEFPEVYDEFTSYQDYEHNVLRTVNSLTDLDHKVILDVGSGTGKFAFEFLPYASHIHLLEPCEPLLTIARWHAANESATAGKMSFILGYANRVPLPDNSVDVVFSGHALTAIQARDVSRGVGVTEGELNERFVARREAVQELLRVLRPGGWLFSLSASPNNYGGALMNLILGDRKAVWTDGKAQFLKWMEDSFGFATIPVRGDWGFPSPEVAARSYGFLFNEQVINYIITEKITQIANPLVLQYLRKGC